MQIPEVAKAKRYFFAVGGRRTDGAALPMIACPAATRSFRVRDMAPNRWAAADRWWLAAPNPMTMISSGDRSRPLKYIAA